MSNFDELVNKIAEYGETEFGKGASPSQIEAAERELGVSVQGSYRQFLERYGWGGVGHLEVYGLGDDVPPFLDLTKQTINERTEARPALPQHLLPIMNDGAGNHYCLDSHQIPNGENSVVIWNHEGGQKQTPLVLFDSFSDWFLDQLKELEP